MRILILLFCVIFCNNVKAQQRYGFQQPFPYRAMSSVGTNMGFGSTTYGGNAAGFPYNQNGQYQQEYRNGYGNGAINNFRFPQRPSFNNGFGKNVNNGFSGFREGPHFIQGVNTLNSQSSTLSGFRSGFNIPALYGNNRPAGFPSTRPFSSSTRPFQRFDGNRQAQTFNTQTYNRQPGEFQGTGGNQVITGTSGQTHPTQGVFGPGQLGHIRQQTEPVSKGPQLRPIRGIFGPGQPGQFDSQKEIQPVQARYFLWE